MIQAQVLKPRKALNPAYLKVKPKRIDIERFKNYLLTLMDQSNEKESEITRLDHEINPLGYELYGLTQEEIRIVEEEIKITTN